MSQAELNDPNDQHLGQQIQHFKNFLIVAEVRFHGFVNGGLLPGCLLLLPFTQVDDLLHFAPPAFQAARGGKPGLYESISHWWKNQDLCSAILMVVHTPPMEQVASAITNIISSITISPFSCKSVLECPVFYQSSKPEKNVSKKFLSLRSRPD
jgi:hypothetical protein